ncbi:unnamed protein product [Rhizoctonia solani]|uniref:Uncharacterized protein n=1 Tax=Rhizoctonia solani TaxID=456999 RepID=A0A8H3DUG1_9AGAM|nr:unnamed protein product [Rhizoctonia solani]
MILDTVDVRYYDLINSGTGIIIYPRLVDQDGNVIWDGRYNNAPSLTIGRSHVYDLYHANHDGRLKGKVFFLSSNTVAGAYYTDRDTAFTYDQNSNKVASAVQTGTTFHGQLAYKGTREKECISRMEG